MRRARLRSLTAYHPRLAGVAPEVFQDLERDRLRLAHEQGLSRAIETAHRREAFLELYDAREGETRWQLWQAHQAKAPAYALVRGRGPEEIAAAKAGYQGDAAILERVEREDAAERARDPAGYGLTWTKGYRRAYEEAQDPAEKAAILWAAQAAAGIPEEGRSPWTAEQGWALTERWIAIDAGAPHQVARARVALLREVLLGLPPEQRAAGVAQLVRLGLDTDVPGRIAAIAAALEQNRPGAAYAAAGPDYRPATQPGLVQIADSGQIASEADPAEASAQEPPDSPALPLEVLVGDPDLPAWLEENRRLPEESELAWSRRVGKAFDEATTSLRRHALYDQILEEIGVPRYGIAWPVHGEDDAEALMRVQGLQDDAWLRARPAPEEAQRAWEAYPPEEQWERLWGGSSENLLYFVGPDGRLYEKDAALDSDSLIFGLLKEAEARLASDHWSAAASGDVLAYIASQPEFIVGIAGAGAVAARGRGRGARLGGLRDPRTLFISEADYQAYLAIKQSGVPLGFASKAEVQAAAASATAALNANSIDDSRLAMRGSAVTGRAYNKQTGRYDAHAFDKGKKPSDWDFAIVSPKLYQRLLLEDPSLARTAGRTIPLNADRMQKLGFTELANWMRQIKRDVSVMVYQSEAAVKGRGPSLWIDP